VFWYCDRMNGTATALVVLLPVLLASDLTAQPVNSPSDPAPLARGYRTRALAGGWGHSWLHGWPGYGKAISDLEYVGTPLESGPVCGSR
jgi:hypothetical protein